MIGTTIAHYKITAKLGAGGMGEVYRAEDTKLGRDVALKLLPHELAGDAERRKRFEREARAIAALKHPNIVTIYSVEEADGHHFITMELIEGQTLSEIIRQGGMTLERFFEISIPLADAVSGAHAQNVTHRDLKPSNVMIEQSGVLKVLDFGLAKLLDPGSEAEGAKTAVGTASDTAVGQILGTAAYMSPEQAEGKPIDSRSDVFSLGIVFYEMATGERPFKGDTHISTISSILKDHPPAITQINQALPRHLGRIVNQCLEKSPGRRFQTATDIRTQLEQLKKEVDTGELASDVSSVSMTAASPAAGPDAAATAVPAPASAPSHPSHSGVGPAPPPSSKRWFILIGTSVGALIVVIVALWMMDRLNPKEPTPERSSSATSTDAGSAPAATARTAQTDDRQTAVVLPFENLGPAEDAYFAAGISEEITSRLAAASGLRVISRTSAVQYDRTGKTMKQIGEDLGVDYVLEGTVRWAKTADGRGRVRITPQLIRVSNDSQMWSTTYDRDVDDIFEVQTDIATRVIDELGVKLLGSERELLDDKPTQNLEAYQAYLRAIDLSGTPGGDEPAVELLERATTLDPGFMAAWYRLARHHSDAFRVLDRTDERLSRAREAVRQAEAIDPNHHATRLARGYYYYYGFRDYDRALDEFTTASEMLPNDSETLAAIGYIRRRQGKLQENIDFLTRALELDPRNVELASNLSATYRGQRRFDEALRLQDRCIELRPDDFNYVSGKVFLYVAMGELEKARGLLRHPPDGDATFYHFAGWTVSNHVRDYTAALAHVRKLDPTSMPFLALVKAVFSAIAEFRESGPAESRDTVEEAVEMLESMIADSPGNSLFHRWLSEMYAQLGRHENAVREARLAVDLTAKDAYSGPTELENLASVYANVGRPDEAIEILERLLSMEYEDAITRALLRSDPRWDPLRGQPRFDELVKEPDNA